MKRLRKSDVPRVVHGEVVAQFPRAVATRAAVEAVLDGERPGGVRVKDQQRHVKDRTSPMQVTVAVELADVARVQPTLRVDRLAVFSGWLG